MIIKGLDAEFVLDDSRIEETGEEIRRQVQEFIRGERKSFDLGSSFPGGGLGFVLRKISEIPYGEIADEVNSSAVAVGQ